jgi:hypothetical protein
MLILAIVFGIIVLACLIVGIIDIDDPAMPCDSDYWENQD